MRTGHVARLFAVVTAATILVSQVGGEAGVSSTPTRVTPTVTITSPGDGDPVTTPEVDVSVEYAANSVGGASGAVHRLELLVDDVVARSHVIKPPKKQGTYTFVGVPIGAAGADGVVKLQAVAYHGDPKAGIAGRSDPIFVGRDPTMVGVEQLRAASLDPPTFTFDNGIPSFVGMRVPIPTFLRGFPPIYAALDYLDRFKALYGLEDPGTQLYGRREARDSDPRIVSFGQKVDGVPIRWANIVVAVGDTDILWTAGHYLPEEPIPQEPEIPAEEATGRALKYVDGPATAVGTPTLEWFDQSLTADVPPNPRLVWRQTVAADERYDVLIDAMTGFLVRRISQHQHDKDFQFEWAEGDTGAATCFIFTETEELGDETGYYDEPFNSLSAPLQADGTDMFYNTHDTYDFYVDNFRYRSYDGDDAQVESYIDWPDGGAGASYIGGCGTIQYGPRWTDDDVTTHEYTHGVTYWSSELVYENQSGALNESFSDIMAAFHDGDWVINDGGRSPGSCNASYPSGAIRDLSNPPGCGDPDSWSTRLPFSSDPDRSNDQGNVHSNSGISNKAAFLMADGGTHNGITVEGMGRGKTMHLLYAVFRGLPDNARIQTAADSSIAHMNGWVLFSAGEDIGGDGPATAEDLCTVINAWAAVERGTPDRDCDGELDDADLDDDGDRVADARDNCASIYNPPQTNTDGDGQGDVCDDDDDADTVPDATDNCPLVANTDQANGDGDPGGDVCDDDDADRVIDTADNCPEIANRLQEDEDGDGQGDACDNDDDGDTIPDATDNCRLTYNPSQRDTDGDGIGDACDNCDAVPNPGQENQDGDSAGDHCDDDIDGDAIANDSDSCPYDEDLGYDLNNDGRDMACDEDEAFMFSGEARQVRFLLEVEEPFVPIRIPIEPCGVRFCEPQVSYINDAFKTTIDFSSDVLTQVNIVDDLGNVYTGDRRSLSKQMSFAPRGDYLYVDTAGEKFSARSFFLEVMPPFDAESGEIITVDFNMSTFNGVDVKPPGDVIIIPK